MRTFLYKNRRFLTLFLVAMAFLPVQAAYGQVCDIPTVRFEIPILNQTSARGITNYFVEIIFPAMLILAPIITLLRITLSAARLGVSFGNSSSWSKFMESVRDSLLVLMLFMAIPFTLVLLGNEEIPTVCPEGLNFAERGFWYECQTTVARNSSECAEFDYCQGEMGCSCGVIDGDSTNVKRCVPAGTNAVAEGLRCQNSENCVGDLRCFNATETTPGLCSGIDEGNYCSDDSSCPVEWSCIETEFWSNNNGRKGCYPNTGRELNSYCTEDSQCESGNCFNVTVTTANESDYTEEELERFEQYNNRCTAGGADDPGGCLDDSQCGPGYHCNEETSECRYNEEGDLCESTNSATDIFDCIPTDGTQNPNGIMPNGVMYCVVTPFTPITYTCQDGSPGDRCLQDFQCLSRSCNTESGTGFRNLGTCD